MNTTPVFSKERRLHTVTGYDNGTKFYYVPDPELNIPELPRKVSDRHISEAFQLIEEILCDFPFVEPADKAHAIAYMLLPFCYDVISSPEKPVFLFKAPMPSTGKSLLVRILSLIYLGSELPVFSWEGSKEEMRKVITSTLMQKPSHFLIDNLNVPLRSSSLAAAVTSGFWQDRILGVSENVRLPIRCIWVITANNPILSREINSRCIPINLNAKIPFPDLRDASDFKHPDLYRWTGAHRGELVAACLTLIKAWIEAGEPEPRERKMTSRFGEWAKVTGGILEHVGISGFLDNIEKQVHAGDEESPVLEEFIYRWYAKFSETAVSTRALVEMIEEENIPIELSVHNKTKSLGQVLKGWEGYVISGGDGDVTVCRGKRRGHGNYVMNWLMLKS